MAVKTTFDFDQMLSNAREAFGEELYNMAKDGLDFVFTYSDNVAPSSSAGKVIKEFPERCFNFGIAEPGQVGASCGMALAGEVVYAQVMGPFLSLRSADQIHTDIAYNDVNVRLIGTHAGVTAGGGPTHNCIADLALYHAIPNLTVVVPADARQCQRAVRASHSFQGPMVIRIDRAGMPAVYADDDYEFEFGKAIETKPGSDVTLIATGSPTYWALMGAKKLEEEYGISVRVVDMHTIKPIDKDMIVKAAKETGNIVTVEEHSINGGLGSQVAEVLLEAGCGNVGFKRVGLPDEFAVLGETDAIYHYYGMDPEGIAKTTAQVLGLAK